MIFISLIVLTLLTAFGANALARYGNKPYPMTPWSKTKWVCLVIVGIAAAMLFAWIPIGMPKPYLFAFGLIVSALGAWIDAPLTTEVDAPRGTTRWINNWEKAKPIQLEDSFR